MWRTYEFGGPSRCGNSPGMRPPTLNMTVICFLFFTWTKLHSPLTYTNCTVPYCTNSVMRASAARMISRTRCMAGLSGCSSWSNQASTSGLVCMSVRAYAERVEADAKQRVAELYSRVAASFAGGAPRFAFAGRRLVEVGRVGQGDAVLDVATGRGAVLLPA